MTRIAADRQAALAEALSRHDELLAPEDAGAPIQGLPPLLDGLSRDLAGMAAISRCPATAAVLRARAELDRALAAFVRSETSGLSLAN